MQFHFVSVYITEAHAADEWPIGNTISFCKQPKKLNERVELARRLTEEIPFPFPVVVDTMENTFDSIFAAWPFRFYIVSATGELLYKAQPDPVIYGYNAEDLTKFLRKY